MSNRNQLNENTRDGSDGQLPKTRPSRHRLAPTSRLRMQFEGLYDELEELLRQATSNSDFSVSQVLQNFSPVDEKRNIYSPEATIQRQCFRI